MGQQNKVDFAEYVSGKRVALVGPAPTYAGLGRGPEIDSYDLVVRMNWGPWERDHADLGSRTDILYKRLLRDAMPDEAEVQRWIDDGVQWVVSSETTDTGDRHSQLEKLVDGRIRLISIGNVRALLVREMKTSPLMGMMALRSLTSYGARVNVMNQPFEHTGYVPNYGGQAYRDSKGDRPNNRIAPIHDIAKHVTWLEKELETNPLVSVDDLLEKRLLMPNTSGMVFIPARLGAKRFPGKPLAKIAGKEMILHVVERAEASGMPVYVCTPDQAIADFVIANGHHAIVTREVLTGTDCVAEAVYAEHRRFRGVIVLIQGDEPLLNHEDIWRLVRARAHAKGAVNGYSPIGDDAENPSVVKAAISGNRMVYASRSAIPGAKDGHRVEWKQLGMYAFKVKDLDLFRKAGHKGPLEASEDVEMLRLIERGNPVYAVELKGTPQSVDHPEDVAKVEALI